MLQKYITSVRVSNVLSLTSGANKYVKKKKTVVMTQVHTKHGSFLHIKKNGNKYNYY